MIQHIIGLLFSVIKKLPTMKYLNRWIVLVIDLLLTVLSALFSYLLISALLGILVEINTLLLIVTFSVVSGITVELVFKLYRGIIRHASMQEASRLLFALFCKDLILLLFIELFAEFSPLWLGFVILDLLLSFFLLISVRALLVSIFYTLVGGDFKGNRRLFIFGTSNHSISLVNLARSGALHPYVVVGLLSSDMEQDGMRIDDLPVYGVTAPDKLRNILSRENVQAVMFAD